METLEKIKQKAKDKRLAFNKTLPPLNLTCDYCNKFFILPGMKENGHKQRPVKYCSGVCQDRESRLKTLKVPKWLYNFYLDKKLYQLVAGYKMRKHWSLSKFHCKRFPIGKFFKKFKKIFISNYGQKPLIYQKTKEFFFHRTITPEGVFTYKLKTWRRFLFGREREKCLYCQESIIHLARDANFCNRNCYQNYRYKTPSRPLLSRLIGRGRYIVYRKYGIKKIFFLQKSIKQYIKVKTYIKRKLRYFKFYITFPFINFYNYFFFKCAWCKTPLERRSNQLYCGEICKTKYKHYSQRLLPIWFYRNIYTKYNLYKIRWQYYPKVKNILFSSCVNSIKFFKNKLKELKKPRVEKKIRLANCKQCEKEFNWEVIVPITLEYNPKSYVRNFCGNECRILFKQKIVEARKQRNLAAWGTEHRPDAQTRKILNAKKMAAYDRNRRKKDPAYLLITKMRKKTKVVLKRADKKWTRKDGFTTYERLGIKHGNEIRERLESLWKPGMSWDNYGIKDGWVIDHIIPLKYFVDNYDIVNDIEIQKKAFGIQNLQPLWWLENAKKSAKMNYEFE